MKLLLFYLYFLFDGCIGLVKVNGDLFVVSGSSVVLLGFTGFFGRFKITLDVAHLWLPLQLLSVVVSDFNWFTRFQWLFFYFYTVLLGSTGFSWVPDD